MINVNFCTKKITVILFYIFSWLGLGTPIIWLSQADQLNSHFYNLFSKLFWLTFLLINMAVFVTNNKRWEYVLKKNYLIYMFIFWLIISSLKSDLEFIAKINIVFSIVICYFMYFNLIVSVCVSHILKIISISLSFYVISSIITLIFNLNEAHVSLIFIYAIFFCLGLYIIIHLQYIENIKILRNLSFKLLYIIIYFLSLLLIFLFLKKYAHYPFVLSLTNNFYNFEALYINLNLFNRLLQVLLLVSSVGIILCNSPLLRSNHFYLFIFLFNFTISFFLILFHKTQNGHLVAIVCTLALIFVFIYIYMIGFFKAIPPLKNKIRRTLNLIIIIAIITTAIISFIPIYNWILYSLNNRIDFVYRFNIWKEIFKTVDAGQLIFGIGLGSPYLTANKNPILDHLSHAHNGFIEIIVQCGILPYVLAAVGLVQFALGCIMSNMKKYSANMIAAKGTLILGLVAMNLFESVSLPYSTSTLLVFVLILISWTNFKDDFGKQEKAGKT